jgi:hypothetical protein
MARVGFVMGCPYFMHGFISTGPNGRIPRCSVHISTGKSVVFGH